MKPKALVCAVVSILMILTSVSVTAKEHGRGHGRGHDRDDEDVYRYSDHDRDAMRGWYRDNENNLPPGLAKRDRLPPGLERQLRLRGTLPPGLRSRFQPLPVVLEQRLAPPPPYAMYGVIGGHIILVNRRTWVVLDIFHTER